METANMKCRIWLPYGKKAKLASYFGVSSETVRKALAFECGIKKSVRMPDIFLCVI